MGAEQAPPTPTPEPERSQSKESTEKPQVSQKGEKREQLMDPAEVAKEKAQKRRDEAKNETSTQEKAQDDLLTRIAKITADNLEKDPQLLENLGKLYEEMDKYSYFQALPQDVMHTLMRSDAIIRGKLARYGDISPDDVNQVAPLNPNEVKNFIALIFNQLSSEARSKVPGPWSQPKSTVTVKTSAEPKNSPPSGLQSSLPLRSTAARESSPDAKKPLEPIFTAEKEKSGTESRAVLQPAAAMKTFETFKLQVKNVIQGLTFTFKGELYPPRTYVVEKIDPTKATITLHEEGDKSPAITLNVVDFNKAYQQLRTKKTS